MCQILVISQGMGFVSALRSVELLAYCQERWRYTSAKYRMAARLIFKRSAESRRRSDQAQKSCFGF